MSTSEQQPAQQPEQHYATGMKAELGLDIKLRVHLDDGTHKDLHLVAHSFKVEKEQE